MNEEIEKKITATSVPKENAISNTSPSLKKPEQKETWGDLIRFALISLAIILPLRFFVAQPFLVSGSSMDPTFHDGNYLIVDEISYRFQEPKRGEVLIFKRPEEDKYLIKRIIGLPGETVELDGRSIKITNKEHKNGFVIDQSFIANMTSEEPRKYTLDENHYFVLGDNRPVSYDSRAWGMLDKKNIVGRAFLRLYPFNRISVFPGDETSVINI